SRRLSISGCSQFGSHGPNQFAIGRCLPAHFEAYRIKVSSKATFQNHRRNPSQCVQRGSEL
ncbi:hypothetical protein NDU88_002692, partial [Pleurodeles waltl]